MHIERSGKTNLWLLYLGICLTLVLRIYAEETNYLSPDSHFYLRVANNLIDGKGLVGPKEYPFDEKTEESYFAIWPPGYPFLIAVTSYITKTSVFIASKIVNLVFLAFSFLLLYKWFGEKAWLPSLYYCSFGMLEVYSYTWSEGVFLFFLLYLCFCLHKSFSYVNKWLFLEISICLILMVFIRYAGLIFFFFTATFLAYCIIKCKYRLGLHLLGSLLIATVVILMFLYFNYLKTGYFTGGYRYFPEAESFPHFFKVLLQGIFNQATIIRNYYFSGYTDYYYLFFLLLQIALIILLYRQRALLSNCTLKRLYPGCLLIFSGMFYLLFIIALRKLSPFESFDYRILAPFSMPIFISILSYFSLQENQDFFDRIYKWITGFFLISLCFNWPKVFIIEKIISLYNNLF